MNQEWAFRELPKDITFPAQRSHLILIEACCCQCDKAVTYSQGAEHQFQRYLQFDEASNQITLHASWLGHKKGDNFPLICVFWMWKCVTVLAEI